MNTTEENSEGSGKEECMVPITGETPRTDAETERLSAMCPSGWTAFRMLADFARDIERQLAEEKAAREWQPIETYQKPEQNGRIVRQRILGWNKEWQTQIIVKWSPQRPAPHWTTDSGSVVEEPSHWMLLPPPPAAMKGEKE